MSRISRRVLFRSQPSDPYLTEVARNVSSHAFLGGAAQVVYVRQVALLRELLPAGARVLDWGAGKGQITYLLRSAGYDVVSCDVPSDRERPIFEKMGYEMTWLDDPVALPFSDGEFDAALSFGVLEHVPDELGSLKQLARVLRPGGRLCIFFLPNSLGWINHLAHLCGNDYHDHLYSRRRLEALAGAASLRVEDAWYGQLFPKNRLQLPQALLNGIERLDRSLTEYTPLKYFATNLEAVLTKV